MTKKDYEKFASMLAGSKPVRYTEEPINRYEGFYEAWALIVSNAADIFKSDNPRFNRERFLAACGIE